MRNIKLTISYDGTNYFGWQKQTNKITIEEVIEKALSKILKEEVDIKGSGRTDGGAHAIGQVANFKTDKKIGLNELKKAVNTILPRDIAIIKTEEMDEHFDSRKTKTNKHYRYIIYNKETHDALNENRKYHYKYKVDIDKMQEAANYIVGKHDFSAFRALGSSSKKVIQEIYSVDITKKENDIIIDIIGSGFLYNMVRIIVGTLLEVGSGKLKPDVTKKMLYTKNRKLGGKTIPAFGLYLIEIKYN